jgi:transposase
MLNDDDILSWLSQTAEEPRPTSADVTCMACGYTGLMRPGVKRGNTICPACLEEYRTRPIQQPNTTDCPNCGNQIEIREKDRGKTMICPACKYFLGCVLPVEKHRHWALRAKR